MRRRWINILMYLPLVMAIVAVGFMDNKIPKVKRNWILGLRTPWSLKNDVVWKKSQRFGGISFVVLGFVTIILSFIGEPVFIAKNFLYLMIAFIIFQILGTYVIYKKTGDAE